jgi:hypothetical protein
MEQIKLYWTKIVAFYNANKMIVLSVLGIFAALFLIPKLYKKFFKRKPARRRRTYRPARSFASRGRSVGRGKGSLYMRRKMARLRNLRRRKK